MSFEQPTLDLQYHGYDRYTITLAKGGLGNMEPVRQHEAETALDAASLIDSLVQTTANRDEVTWEGDEVDDRGILNGLAPGGVVYSITVVPPLSEPLKTS